jgi:hypothetical protein
MSDLEQRVAQLEEMVDRLLGLMDHATDGSEATREVIRQWSASLKSSKSG